MPNDVKQCFLGLRYIEEKLNNDSSLIYFAKILPPISTPNVDITFPYSASSIMFVKYTGICLARCPNDTVPYGSGLSLICSNCRNLTNCVTCRS